jgi:2-polyprenyl-6-methoxyphenol hydroxylase-like FAD-dependent oxidoreductase
MTDSLETRCCIAGGGPAGMMLGFLLARAGVDVVVLEKHADFLRDFRGDTIHPSTLTVMADLGLLDQFLELPHQRVERLTANVYGQSVTIADFSHVAAARPYLVLMPQWDFLDFIAGQGRVHSHFHLHMNGLASGVVERDGVVTGVQAVIDGRPTVVACDLAVAADGRHTTLRGSAGLDNVDLGAPMDVLWFRLSRSPSTTDAQTGGYVRPGLLLVAIDRGSYWQCGYVIPKGGLDQLQAAGLDALKRNIADCAPFLQDSLGELAGWKDLKLLTVQVSRMPRWYRDGLLCIGDAAHAMSPVGGVGINLAIQDAVAAANLLADPLRERRLQTSDLAAVQRRRDWPTRLTQRMQIAVQNEVLVPVLAGQSGRGTSESSSAPSRLPLPLQMLRRLPRLSRIPARMIGVGVRPERVRSRAAPPPGMGPAKSP